MFRRQWLRCVCAQVVVVSGLGRWASAGRPASGYGRRVLRSNMEGPGQVFHVHYASGLYAPFLGRSVVVSWERRTLTLEEADVTA